MFKDDNIFLNENENFKFYKSTLTDSINKRAKELGLSLYCVIAKNKADGSKAYIFINDDNQVVEEKLSFEECMFYLQIEKILSTQK